MKAKLKIFLIKEYADIWLVKFQPIIPPNYILPRPKPMICLSRKKYTHLGMGCWHEIDQLEMHSCLPNFYKHGLQVYVNRVATDFDKAIGRLDSFQVGDEVKIKPSVLVPTCGWGSMEGKTHEVGTVIYLSLDRMNANFPSQHNWGGKFSEFIKADE